MKTRLKPPRIPKAPPALPLDLVPIPVRDHPYPHDQPLDPDEVRAALWHGRGNLKNAAAFLNTSPARLGALCRRDPALATAREEAAEMLIDEAEALMIEAMQSEDPVRADSAARFVLEHAGRIRGWTRDGTGGISLSLGGASGQGGALAVKWQTE